MKITNYASLHCAVVSSYSKKSPCAKQIGVYSRMEGKYMHIARPPFKQGVTSVGTYTNKKALRSYTKTLSRYKCYNTILFAVLSIVRGYHGHCLVVFIRHLIFMSSHIITIKASNTLIIYYLKTRHCPKPFICSPSQFFL